MPETADRADGWLLVAFGDIPFQGTHASLTQEYAPGRCGIVGGPLLGDPSTPSAGATICSAIGY